MGLRDGCKQVKEKMLESANQTIAELKDEVDEAHKEAADVKRALEEAEMRVHSIQCQNEESVADLK